MAARRERSTSGVDQLELELRRGNSPVMDQMDSVRVKYRVGDTSQCVCVRERERASKHE